MNGYDIVRAVDSNSTLSEVFQGVFASDMLPRFVNHPCAIIANTDRMADPGSHWVGFYITPDGRGEYFDSYGLPPLDSKFIGFLERNCSSWSYNPYCLQHLESKACGHYSLMYLVSRAEDVPAARFFTQFSQNSESNDCKVLDQFRRVFGCRGKTCVDMQAPGVQCCRPRATRDKRGHFHHSP